MFMGNRIQNRLTTKPAVESTTETLLKGAERPGGFPGGPVVKTLHFHCRGLGSIPGLGTKILQSKKKKRLRKKKIEILHN